MCSILPTPYSSVGGVVDLRTRGRWFDAYSPIFFQGCMIVSEIIPHLLLNIVSKITLFMKESSQWLERIFFPRIDESHCDRIHSSLTAVRCFYKGYVGKQPVAWKEYFAEHWFSTTGV